MASLQSYGYNLDVLVPDSGKAEWQKRWHSESGMSR